MNEAYRGFYDLLAPSVTTAVANGRAYDDQRRRAKALADVDHRPATGLELPQPVDEPAVPALSRQQAGDNRPLCCGQIER